MNKKIIPENRNGILNQLSFQDLNGITLVFFPEIKWNGTFLGTIDDRNITTKEVINGKDVWLLNFLQCKVMVNTAINMLPCINDEILDLFSLAKIGTHSVMYKNSLYILYKLEEHDNLLYSKPELVSEKTTREIRQIIVLKRKLGWSKFDEKNIILRWNNNLKYYRAIPLHENTISNFKNVIVTKKMYTKWIGIEIIDNQIFKDCLIWKIKKALIVELYMLISKIEKIILSIEPELVYIKNDLQRVIFQI